jgi:aspartyl-tRNA(Asn)/glutamyl-tRNA(Gln) amidotransferase subunit A
MRREGAIQIEMAALFLTAMAMCSIRFIFVILYKRPIAHLAASSRLSPKAIKKDEEEPLLMALNARFSDWAAVEKVKQVAAVATAVDRAARLEPRLHAFVEFERPNIDRSLNGPLAFIPYAAKDIFITPEHRPKGGLGEFWDFDLSGCADVLRRLDDAGAIRIGFTAMTELAYEPSGFNAVSAYPRNPWNLDFIPGGSSSGSAVAVASGAVAIALGSDTGGSIRIPAHCCGLTGWKPTWGSVSSGGAMPLAPLLDCVGLLARSAADLAAAAALLTSNARPQKAIKRAVVIVDALDGAEPTIRRACQDGIDHLHGCGVATERVEALSAIGTIDYHALIVMQGEAARTHRSLIDNPGLSPVLRKRLEKGLSIDDRTLDESRAARKRLAEDFITDVLGTAEAAILPVMPNRTPPYSEVDPASPTFSGRRLYALSSYCRFVNMLGFPALAIPVGFDDRGLPVGMQIVGRPDADLDLIAVARVFQERTDWHARVPIAVRDIVDKELLT